MSAFAQMRPERNENPVIRLTVRLEDGSVITAQGRDAWALSKLIEAGDRGCTPIEHVGPRWSHYVWKLRGFGLAIETINETHDGPYSGRHARYLLRSGLTVISEVRR